MDLDIKVPQVIFVRNSTDAWDSVYTRSVSDNISGARSVDRLSHVRFGHQTFGLLHNSLW